MKPIEWSWLGRVPYERMLERQRSHRRSLIEGTASEVIWFLEHDPVITTGRRLVSDLPTTKQLQKHGISICKTERGGLATFHGPGQLIAYPIIDAWKRGLGARGTVHALEAAVIQWLDEHGICAGRREGFPGVWVEKEKICAIGMHFRRGISMHGIALNLDPEWSGFELITPCGIQDGGVTSVARLLGSACSVNEAAETLAPHIIDRLMRRCPPRSSETG